MRPFLWKETTPSLEQISLAMVVELSTLRRLYGMSTKDKT